MSHHKRITVFLLTFFAMSIAAQTAWAESRHTYVDPTIAENSSGPGQQSSQSCDSPRRACKTIAEAVSKTRAGGTVTLLKSDPADVDDSSHCAISYSTGAGLTIAKSITIEAARGLKTKPCFLVNRELTGIVVDDEAQRAVVRLRGLRFVLGEGGSIGVSFVRGARLQVDTCWFGIVHGISVRANGELTVVNSSFKTAKGVMLEKATSKVRATIDGCKFIGHNDVAILARENREVVVTNSDFPKVDAAVWLYDNASVLLKNSRISFTESPFQVDGSATLTLNGVKLTHG